MSDWRVFVTILAIGSASYAMRAGGFLAVGTLREGGAVLRFIRLAPGNLCVAFAAGSCLTGGWPSLAGCLSALATMAITKKEWAALAAGFGAAAVSAVITKCALCV